MYHGFGGPEKPESARPSMRARHVSTLVICNHSNDSSDSNDSNTSNLCINSHTSNNSSNTIDSNH